MLLIIQEQQQQVSAIQTRHLAELKTASQDLIASQVASISGKNTVLDFLRNQILTQVTTTQQQELASLRADNQALRNRLSSVEGSVNVSLFMNLIGACIFLPPAIVFWKIFG